MPARAQENAALAMLRYSGLTFRPLGIHPAGQSPSRCRIAPLQTDLDANTSAQISVVLVDGIGCADTVAHDCRKLNYPSGSRVVYSKWSVCRRDRCAPFPWDLLAPSCLAGLHSVPSDSIPDIISDRSNLFPRNSSLGYESLRRELNHAQFLAEHYVGPPVRG